MKMIRFRINSCLYRLKADKLFNARSNQDLAQSFFLTRQDLNFIGNHAEGADGATFKWSSILLCLFLSSVM